MIERTFLHSHILLNNQKNRIREALHVRGKMSYELPLQVKFEREFGDKRNMILALHRIGERDIPVPNTEPNICVEDISARI